MHASPGVPTSSTRLLLVRYAVPVVWVSAAVGALLLMSTYLRTAAPVSLLLVAVLASAWRGGARSGAFATALAIAAFGYFFLPPVRSFGIEKAYAPRLILFAALAAFVVWIVHSRRAVIDDLERSNDALRESERKLSEATRLAHVGYWDYDLITDVVTWSPEVARIFGQPADKVSWPFAEVREMIHPGDRHILDEANERARRGEPNFRVEWRVVRPDGEVRYVEKIVESISDPTGHPARASGAVVDITERKRSEEALRKSADRLQQLSSRLLEVQEDERRHLSRELHDEFGTLVATVVFLLHGAKSLAGEAVQSRLDESIRLLRDTGDRIRDLALELRPTMLESTGLDSTLRWLAEEHERHTGVPVQVNGAVGVVPDDKAIVCFRIVQEALTNVARHAQARHVWIELSRHDEFIELIVRDDGTGFDVDDVMVRSPRGRLGLLGMRERVQLLGGTFSIESRSGHGTRIRALLPLQALDTQASD